tara:strand:+ start:828 stop:1082 length:255 start_codon:yes stop_codon:yes gene_type:complete
VSASNPCAKTRPVENPYEVWKLGDWTWKVLKKYQKPEREAKNPYARWFCAVSTPYTYGSYDMGDVYVTEITNHAERVDDERDKG